MGYFHWGNQYPCIGRRDLVSYPASAYPDGYMTPLPEYYDRVNFNLEVGEIATAQNLTKPLAAEDEEMIKISEGMSRDITRIFAIISLRACHEVDEIVTTGMNRKLLDYIIRAMVQYLDKNYDKYQGSIPQKMEMAIYDIKRDLKWALEIIRIYNVSPATEIRLIDKIARAVLQ